MKPPLLSVTTRTFFLFEVFKPMILSTSRGSDYAGALPIRPIWFVFCSTLFELVLVHGTIGPAAWQTFSFHIYHK